MAKKPLPRRRVTPKKRSQPTKSKPTPPADGRVKSMKELKEFQKAYGGVIRGGKGTIPNVGNRDKPLTPPQQQEARKLNKALADAEKRMKDLRNAKVRQGEVQVKQHNDQLRRAAGRITDLRNQLENVGRERAPGSTGRDKSGGYQVSRDPDVNPGFERDPRPPVPKPRPPRPIKEAPRPEIRDDIPQPAMETKIPKPDLETTLEVDYAPDYLEKKAREKANKNKKPSPTFQKGTRFGGAEYVTGLNPSSNSDVRFTQANIPGTYKGKSGYYTDGSRNTFIVDGAQSGNTQSAGISNTGRDRTKGFDVGKALNKDLDIGTVRAKQPDPPSRNVPSPGFAAEISDMASNYKKAVSQGNPGGLQSSVNKIASALDSSPLRTVRSNKDLDNQVNKILGGSSGVNTRGAFSRGIRNVFN